MITTTHPVAPEEVMAFLDGELSPEQARLVTEHLEQCESCSARASEMRGVSTSMSSWQIAPPMLAANDLHTQARPGSRHLEWLPAPARWGLLTITGVVLLAVILSTQGHHGRGVSKPVREILREPAVQPQEKARTSLGDIARYDAEVATDLNGQFHGLGDRVSVDGQPRADQDATLSKIFAAPMIARRVSLSLVVKDFAAARASLDAILARHHGYAAELTANTAENAQRSLEGSLRVPAFELDAAISDLKALGRVEKETRSGEEVSQQHADLIARLKNSRETEQRLQAILQQRTGKVKDILEVEQEIARVRGEIEEMDAQQKSLEHRVDFATVNLSLLEEYKAQFAPPGISAGTRLHNALVAGYRDASETLLGIVLFFAEYTLTLLVWGLILVLPVILVWKRYRRSLAAARQL